MKRGEDGFNVHCPDRDIVKLQGRKKEGGMILNRFTVYAEKVVFFML